IFRQRYHNREVTPMIAVEKFVNRCEYKWAIDKVLAFLNNNFLKLPWMSSGISCSGWCGW
ncbi:hypothetical protein AMR41_13355, partial [Hapalosiphon sp. MRB220]